MGLGLSWNWSARRWHLDPKKECKKKTQETRNRDQNLAKQQGKGCKKEPSKGDEKVGVIRGNQDSSFKTPRREEHVDRGHG